MFSLLRGLPHPSQHAQGLSWHSKVSHWMWCANTSPACINVTNTVHCFLGVLPVFDNSMINLLWSLLAAGYSSLQVSVALGTPHLQYGGEGPATFGA